MHFEVPVIVFRVIRLLAGEALRRHIRKARNKRVVEYC